MQILIFIRDLILSILMSWIGADTPADTNKEKKEPQAAPVHKLSWSECERPKMVLLKDENVPSQLETRSSLVDS